MAKSPKIDRAWKRLGLSKVAAARAIGCSSATVSFVLSGERDLSLELAIPFARLLNIEVADMPLTEAARVALALHVPSPQATAQ